MQSAGAKFDRMNHLHLYEYRHHFDYNNHIVFISTHTKIGTPHEKELLLPNGSEFVWLPENYMRLLAPYENKHPFRLLISKIDPDFMVWHGE